MEQILWPEGAAAEHAAPSDQQQVDILDQHRKTGFVLEKELLTCVLVGTYLGPYGPTERRCESGGVHECRHLKTSDFGGQIVIREPFYSVEHI